MKHISFICLPHQAQKDSEMDANLEILYVTMDFTSWILVSICKWEVKTCYFLCKVIVIKCSNEGNKKTTKKYLQALDRI